MSIQNRQRKEESAVDIQQTAAVLRLKARRLELLLIDPYISEHF